MLAEALGLWRGQPLSGVGGDWATAVRAGLVAQRLSVLGDRIDADLQRGLEVVDELTTLGGEQLMNERFSGQLMRALHAVGLGSEARAEAKVRTLGGSKRGGLASAPALVLPTTPRRYLGIAPQSTEVHSTSFQKLDPNPPRSHSVP